MSKILCSHALCLIHRYNLIPRHTVSGLIPDDRTNTHHHISFSCLQKVHVVRTFSHSTKLSFSFHHTSYLQSGLSILQSFFLHLVNISFSTFILWFSNICKVPGTELNRMISPLILTPSSWHRHFCVLYR